MSARKTIKLGWGGLLQEGTLTEPRVRRGARGGKAVSVEGTAGVRP